jgi:hypothetical protein
MEIPRATATDFQKATQRVYRSRGLASSVTVLVETAPRPATTITRQSLVTIEDEGF